MIRLRTRLLVALVNDLTRPLNALLDKLDALMCAFPVDTDAYCTDCPDGEACATGYPCEIVRRAAPDRDELRAMDEYAWRHDADGGRDR